jgi:deoxyribodipyrimidine photo-lyase
MERSGKQEIAIFWFRRDLRLEDNCGLYQALKGTRPVLPLFIFDTTILDQLSNKTDQRVSFIYHHLSQLQENLCQQNSTLLVTHGKPLPVWKKLLKEWPIKAVYSNADYEPYALQRDKQISRLLKDQQIDFHLFKDQVIFQKEEVLKKDGKPYTVFTPYKNKWRDTLKLIHLEAYPSQKFLHNLLKIPPLQLPSLKAIGFHSSDSSFPIKDIKRKIIENYHHTRDFPALENGTSHLGVHLRFGTISIRQLARLANELNDTFLNELIWREFFMMILYHFPEVVEHPFKRKYERIQWSDNEGHFKKWCAGRTGFPLVDAGMRQLNQSGYMHNRVRMICANFLSKLLLINWQWGEKYFADKLLDFELSSNNGNWQWAAGCGCDAAPYFRIFNPDTQLQKFDQELLYVKKWVPEYDTPSYPGAIVDYKFARERALSVYQSALND